MPFNALRRKRRAFKSMLGHCAEEYFQQSTRIMLETGLHRDEWSRSNNAIFIHVPKNAGTSVQTALGNLRDDQHHMPAEAYRRADPEFFAQAYKFAFSRNPWDRLVSTFHFITGSDHPFNQLITRTDLRGTPDFATFLRKLRNPLYRHQVISRLHFMPQTQFICDSDGKLIIDTIGRFEALPGSFDAVTAPLPGTPRLPQHNVGKHKHYTSYYEHEWQVKLVGAMYRADCDLLGYQFET